MKKAAFIASVSGHIQCFHIPYLKYFKEKGYETYVVTRDEETIDYCDKHITVPFERSPFSKSTFIAYGKLKKVIEKENFDIIHCHTPVAAFLTRLASRKARKKGTKVIYTAHGFHFFKGAPLLNWLIYFPIEWISSFFTDALITINKEDYKNAKKYLHAKNTYYTHGIGVNSTRFSEKEVEKNEILESLNIGQNAKIIFSVGELNKNKNHKVILNALAKIKDDNLFYIIAGDGPMKGPLLALAKELKVSDRFKLLGYRNDIDKLLRISDVFCFPSYREGLPLSVMEAMSSGVPVVASDIRGNSDLIDNGKGGFLCQPENSESFKESIQILLENQALREEFVKYNKKKIQNFSLQSVLEEMINIYKEQKNEL